MTQKQIRQNFEKAMARGDISKARDIVTLLFAMDFGQKEYKLEAYRAIVMKALQKGNIDAAHEAAPFCNYIINRDDYMMCMELAMEHGDIQTFVTCKEHLDEEMRGDEINNLLKKADIESPYFMLWWKLGELPKRIPDDLAAFLSKLLKKVPAHTLTLEERMLVRLKL